MSGEQPMNESAPRFTHAELRILTLALDAFKPLLKEAHRNDAKATQARERQVEALQGKIDAELAIRTGRRPRTTKTIFQEPAGSLAMVAETRLENGENHLLREHRQARLSGTVRIEKPKYCRLRNVLVAASGGRKCSL